LKFTKLTFIALLIASCNPVFASGDTAERVTGSLSGQDTINEIESIATGDELFNKLIHQESRGNQFGRNGQPLTSPKGAVGVAQVMPDTAPEAARLAGLEWSAWRYRNDATYNKALGRAYLDSQLDKYDGNHVLALAAYNAGPGSVDRWLKRFGDPRTGEISNQKFMQLIPFLETQAYVATILNGTSGKFSNSPSRRKAPMGEGHKVEFRDTHPGFTFSLAVNQTFSTGNGGGKLVGGL
jgi:soluble lytic murein transglycosylase